VRTTPGRGNSKGWFTAMWKLRIGRRGKRDWVGDALNVAVSRRPPYPSHTIVGRTESYAYDSKVWAACIVQGPFSSRRAKLNRRCEVPTRKAVI
jgi:hypothetical protein